MSLNLTKIWIGLHFVLNASVYSQQHLLKAVFRPAYISLCVRMYILWDLVLACALALYVILWK
jgi:hypothetical protein